MSQRPIVIDDTDNRIQYNGQGWFQDNGSQDQFGNYGPTYKHTLHGTTSSNSLSFSFKGTSVRVMGTTNLAKIDDTHYDPSWECFVDNVSIGATTPFQYRENNWVMCEKNGLSDASHDLTMKVTITKGNTFWFDSVQYVPSPSDVYDTEVLLVDNHDPAIQWGSGWGPLGGGANVTSVHGSNARFDFTGTGLSWVGFVPTELAHAASTGSYTIDGGNPVSFSLNGLPANDKTTVYNQIFFTTPQLAAGPHSLVVTYNGDSQHTPLTLDFIYLTNKTLAAPPPTTAGTGSSLPSSLPSTSSPNGGNVSSAPGSQPSSNSPAGTGTDPFGAGAATNSPVGPSGASSPSNNTTSSGSKPPLGAIVGGVLGGIAILLLIALLAFFLRRRPRKERRVSLIDRSEPGFAPFMSTYDNTQPINPHFNPPPAPSSSTGSYDPYGGYVVASSHNGSTTSSAPAVQRSHPGHSQNQSLSHSDPASVGGGGYNWGAAAAGAGAGAGVLQPLRKDREAGAERLLYERELVHHQDSGVRLPAARPRVVEEIPPMYTLS